MKEKKETAKRQCMSEINLQEDGAGKKSVAVPRATAVVARNKKKY